MLIEISYPVLAGERRHPEHALPEETREG